ncbi:hypothetical protein MMC07_005694 [Pseudocyphellaria aurata]|nr:hypothetical protein [Pseudocyphellaria aurata]
MTAFCVAAAASDAGAALKAGDAAFAKGEFTAAATLYTRAVQADVRGLLPLTKRAAAYGKLGDHRSALRDLDEALQLDATSVQALLHRHGPRSQAQLQLPQQQHGELAVSSKGRLNSAVSPAHGPMPRHFAPFSPARHLKPFASCDVKHGLCSFSAAEADLTRLQGIRPTHKGAIKELSEVAQGQAELSKATAASASVTKCGTGTIPFRSTLSSSALAQLWPPAGPAATRKALAAVFAVAPDCLPAKLLEARLMLQEGDHGAHAAQAEQVRLAAPPPIDGMYMSTGVVAMTGQLLKGQPGNVEALLLRGQVRQLPLLHAASL